MKIAAVAQAGPRMEIGLKTLPPGVEWIWVDSVNELSQRPDSDMYFDLDFVMDQERIWQLGQLLPKPVIINSVQHTLAEIDRPFVRINAWPGFLQRSYCELAVTVVDKPAGSDSGKLPEFSIGKLFEELNWPYRIVPDTPGLISARILSVIINEAYHTLQAGVSTKEEIDTAMKLGTNYPFGPFEWSQRIGLASIYSLLEVLGRSDNRYKVAEALEEELQRLKFD